MATTELTPWQMVISADPVVQAVIVLLAAASVWSWYIILTSILGLSRLRAALKSRGGGGPFAAIWDTAGLAAGDGSPFERRQAAAARMKRRAQELLDGLQSALPNLAVIASVAPFLGLFGTVWGIMNSFINIAAKEDTSLAVVAPGIAEALIVTAIGLAVAIPAAFAYNRLSASFARQAKALGRAIDDHAEGLAPPNSRIRSAA
jgi:biopolymer transport protein ExbB/TolQ